MQKYASCQIKKFVKNNPVAERLENYRLMLGITWRQAADRLEISLPMLMQVRSGLRNMGPLALQRLEAAEQSAASELRANKLVAGLLDDHGSTQDYIKKLLAEQKAVTIPLQYRRMPGAESLPKQVVLTNLAETNHDRLLTLFRRTLDPKIIILGCVGGQGFDEELLTKITPTCLQILQQAAMTLTLGKHWRSIIVKMALSDPE